MQMRGEGIGADAEEDPRIDIGGEDPIDHDRYVRIGDEVLRVPDRFSARLLESPESELLDPKTAQ